MIINMYEDEDEVVWLSINRGKTKTTIEYYPKNISNMIEKAYNERNTSMLSYCDLKYDHVNIRIYFDTAGNCYQLTTGSKRHKNNGFKSVEREVHKCQVDSLNNRFRRNYIKNMSLYREIPHDYCCCISQELMIEPVKTVDNQTYDRKCIERWFLEHDTSPLTGLHLESKILVPNVELKISIDRFLTYRNKISNTNIIKC